MYEIHSALTKENIVRIEYPKSSSWIKLVVNSEIYFLFVFTLSSSVCDPFWPSSHDEENAINLLIFLLLYRLSFLIY